MTKKSKQPVEAIQNFYTWNDHGVCENPTKAIIIRSPAFYCSILVAQSQSGAWYSAHDYEIKGTSEGCGGSFGSPNINKEAFNTELDAISYQCSVVLLALRSKQRQYKKFEWIERHLTPLINGCNKMRTVDTKKTTTASGKIGPKIGPLLEPAEKVYQWNAKNICTNPDTAVNIEHETLHIKIFVAQYDGKWWYGYDYGFKESTHMAHYAASVGKHGARIGYKQRSLAIDAIGQIIKRQVEHDLALWPDLEPGRPGLDQLQPYLIPWPADKKVTPRPEPKKITQNTAAKKSTPLANAIDILLEPAAPADKEIIEDAFKWNDAGCCLNPSKVIDIKYKKLTIDVSVAYRNGLWYQGHYYGISPGGTGCGVCSGKPRTGYVEKAYAISAACIGAKEYLIARIKEEPGYKVYEKHIAQLDKYIIPSPAAAEPKPKASHGGAGRGQGRPKKEAKSIVHQLSIEPELYNDCLAAMGIDQEPAKQKKLLNNAINQTLKALQREHLKNKNSKGYKGLGNIQIN